MWNTGTCTCNCTVAIHVHVYSYSTEHFFALYCTCINDTSEGSKCSLSHSINTC